MVIYEVVSRCWWFVVSRHVLWYLLRVRFVVAVLWWPVGLRSVPPFSDCFLKQQELD
jgi:hypothetical protein